ncbi:MAG: magnesium transporter CorA family protein [Promethearchaeota archaeon]
MKLTYFILRDLIELQPLTEQVEITLDDLRTEEYDPDSLKNNCICSFLDVYLEEDVIDINHLNQEILDMTIILDISLDTLEEIVLDSRPRLDDYEDYLFVLFKSIGKHPTEVEGKREYQCGIVVDENIVISIHLGHPFELERLFRTFIRNPKKLSHGGITHLTSCYIDALIDPLYDVVDGWRRIGDDIEWKILSEKKLDGHKTLSRLIGIRESIFDTVKILQADREVVNKMLSPNMPIFKKSFIPPELNDHVMHLKDELDIMRSTISDLMNLYFNSEGKKMNTILARFTFVTSILLLPNLIAGIFGMNNPYFPQISFWWVIGIIVASMAVLWFYFKHNKLI